MSDLIKIIRQLFCKHSYIIDRWHFTHGQCGNEPRYIEEFEKCLICDKERYFTVNRGSKLETYIMKYMLDREI